MSPTDVQEDVSTPNVEFHFWNSGHAPAGCSNGWFLQPFPVFVWNVRGYGETQYWDERLGTIPRPEGSVAYVLPNEARKSVTKSPDGLDFVVAGFAFEYRGGANFLNRFHIENPLPPPIQEELRRCLEKLGEVEQTAGTPSYRREIVRRKCGYEILDALMSIAVPRGETADPEWERMAPAIVYLNRNYRKKFEIGPLLRLTSLSRVHFYRLFQKRFHVSPQEYALRLRIREAVELLLQTNLNIAEIGARVGWEDSFYFSRIFKSTVGVSPLNYRKKPGGIP